MMIHIETTLRMGCMAGAGYAFGTLMKTDPKFMAIAWLCGEVAIEILQKWTLMPLLSETLPHSAGGIGVAHYLTKNKIIVNNFESGIIAALACTSMSILLEQLTCSFLTTTSRSIQRFNNRNR